MYQFLVETLPRYDGDTLTARHVLNGEGDIYERLATKANQLADPLVSGLVELDADKLLALVVLVNQSQSSC